MTKCLYFYNSYNRKYGCYVNANSIEKQNVYIH